MENKRLKASEEFVKKSKLIHGNKYDYSRVDYIDSSTKVCIICPVHGEFWQRPIPHRSGQGCPKCNIEDKRLSLRLSQKEFLDRLIEFHGNTYDLSKVCYVDAKTKICSICSEHGEFFKLPGETLKSECPECEHGLIVQRNKNIFINRAKDLFKEYDFNNVEYIDAKNRSVYNML